MIVPCHEYLCVRRSLGEETVCREMSWCRDDEETAEVGERASDRSSGAEEYSYTEAAVQMQCNGGGISAYTTERCSLRHTGPFPPQQESVARQHALSVFVQQVFELGGVHPVNDVLSADEFQRVAAAL